MEELDDDVPDLVPVLDVDSEGKPVKQTDQSGPVYEAPKRLDKTVPVTLITGFLGAGKTTLVNYILTENHGFRIAVILNEIGDQKGIEKALLQDEGGGKQNVDEWVELTNGCLCCSVKDDFVNALESLMLQQSVFDYILIETTGLANPGPVAAALWTDEELEAGVVLDCIVTVADAKNIRRQLTGNTPEAIPGQAGAHDIAATPGASSSHTPGSSDAHLALGVPGALPPSGQSMLPVPRSLSGEAAAAQPHAAEGPPVNEAQQQVAYADVILLNKTDLVPPEELQEVRRALLRHNAAAEVVECANSRVDLRKILDRGSYKRAALEAAAVALPPAGHGAAAAEGHRGGAAAEGCSHDECGGAEGPCGHDHGHDHRHGHNLGHDHTGVMCSHDRHAAAAAAAGAPISHDPAVSTVTLRIDEPVALEGFKVWMDTLLWESAAVVDIFRVKGLLHVAGSDRKHGLQAVHELYDVAEGPQWTDGEERCSRVVVIGRRLDRAQLEQSLRQACLPGKA